MFLKGTAPLVSIGRMQAADALSAAYKLAALIRHALYPYPDEVLVATKVGMIRPAPNVWAPHGHPGYLRACVEASLRRLGRERLDLCYLHRIDPEVSIEDQLGTVQALKGEGKIGHIGLSKRPRTFASRASTSP